MKSLFIVMILGKVLYSSYYATKIRENFLAFKCIIYFCISSIHSIILQIPIPIGAIIMFIIYLFDNKNKKIKLKMIGIGLLVVFLSIFDYSSLSHPLKKLYLYASTYDIQKIEVYAYTIQSTNFLFDITTEDSLDEWINSLQTSIPSTSWGTKILPNEYGYLLKLHLSNKTLDLYVSPYSTKYANLFVSNKYFSYNNSTILSFISKSHPSIPSILTINTSKNSSVNITNTTLLNILWKNIMWSPKELLTVDNKDTFTIPAYLFFDTTLGYKLLFSSDFKMAYIQNKGVINLSPYLQRMLGEQFILSQLDVVNELDIFEPAHIYNEPNSSINFSIEASDNNLYYGLYLEDYKNHEKSLLHTVSSPNAKYFLLNNPYILLLDEKNSDQYSLMLINQNIPDKHRYLSKNQNILPHSLSICPQNIKFTYIAKNQDNSTLYFVDNYYTSPKPITTGDIYDSLFLSNEYIVFTQQINDENFLCIYSTVSSKTIKYILIPGNITLINGGDNRVFFAVQKVENLTLHQGIFYIDSALSLHKSNQLPK